MNDYLVPKELLSEWAEEAFREGHSRGRLSKKIREYLQAHAEGLNTYELDGQEYTLSKYADLAARTVLREAQTKAWLDLCQKDEIDLFEISDHSTTCEICKEFEGNIYSISGTHPDYLKLEKMPPFHTACKHSMLATSDETIELRKREMKRREGGESKQVAFNTVSKLLSGMGNVGYLWDHVMFFEDKLPEEIAPYEEEFKGIDTKNYAYYKCHYFSAWIRLYTELICNKALGKVSHAEHCEKSPIKYRFEDAIKKIVEAAQLSAAKRRIEPGQFEEMARCLKLVVELRHSFQHGGVPSIVRDHAQIEGIDLKDVADMVNPKMYRETKKIFAKANNLIHLVPTNIISFYQDGHFEFRSQIIKRSKS